MTTQTVTLWEHQAQSIYGARAALASITQGRRSVVVQIPTGGGKTTVAATMADMAVKNGKRVLAIAHRTELIEQLASTFERTGVPVAVVAASSTRRPWSRPSRRASWREPGSTSSRKSRWIRTALSGRWSR